MLSLSFFSDFSAAFVRELGKFVPGHANLREGILDKLYYGPRFVIPLPGGHSLRISDSLISMWICMLVLILLCLFFRRSISLRPGRRQTLIEALLSSIRNGGVSAGLTEEQADSILPYVATLGLFITFSNLSSLFELKPPAQNPVFPVSLALVTLIFIIYKGIRLAGLRGFVDSLLQPMPALLPFKILDYIIKPVSLAFRLFGNIFGAYILMKFIALVLPLAIPGLLGLWFDLGDGIVQGVVFAYLTMTYIGEIVEGANEARELRLAKAQRRQAAQSQ